MSQKVTATATESRRETAAVLLAGGATQGDTAREVGVSRKTVNGWWQDPDFRKQVRTQRARLIEAASGVLADAARDAALNLVRLANEPHANGSVRLGACRSVLSFGTEMVIDQDIEERLTALEERMGL